MNLAYLRPTVSLAHNAWDKFADYRDQKAREAYAALESAAGQADTAISEAFPRARREAGAVTRAAHARLERTLEELSSQGEDAAHALGDRVSQARSEAAKSIKKAKKQGRAHIKEARKTTRKEAKAAKKQAHKQAKKYSKRAKSHARSHKKSRGAWTFGALVALIAAALGGLYYYLRKNDIPSEQPPRVEEFAADSSKVSGSTLVYTSTSASDLAEEPVRERDEELLGAIDSQLADLRGENGDSERITDAEPADASAADASSADAPAADAPASDTAASDTADGAAKQSGDDAKHRLDEGRQKN
ncbi:hypothetical protein G7Y31_00165 [Corynebacterium lizhenjunii]|uniref:Uncharacterized protein n=1 Tax=Corynebacterium lizhenjunii TaxID=2709394 RepID=A0A7T0KE90_9CORY|nr:hypothetical protein [Corynebacterium lizhenjunii]QPK79193.1 hypothetical protein G7Y31_00165 [Corynebacterium lizhenjunii]